VRPAVFGLKTVSTNLLAAAQVSELLRVSNPDHTNTLRARSHNKSRKCSRCIGILKRLGGRLDERQRLAPKMVQKQLAHQLAIIHVKPFRCCNKHAKIIRPCLQSRCEKEMHMQSGQLAGTAAKSKCAICEPPLSIRLDLVVPNVRRVSYEERGAGDQWKFQRTVVANYDSGTAREPTGR
jgi:hypothetical protein